MCISNASIDLHTDRRHLITQAYADGAHLAARADIYRYQRPRIDLAGWVLAQVNWTGTGQVLGIGCGPGTYPRITHCGNPRCDRCNDAVQGGPIKNEGIDASTSRHA